jgi:hypothetical protein
MPEAAMNKHHRAPLRKDEIRLSWQVFAMQAKAQTSGMQCTPKKHFRLGIARPDPGHHAAADIGRDDIRHVV